MQKLSSETVNTPEAPGTQNASVATLSGACQNLPRVKNPRGPGGEERRTPTESGANEGRETAQKQRGADASPPPVSLIKIHCEGKRKRSQRQGVSVGSPSNLSLSLSALPFSLAREPFCDSVSLTETLKVSLIRPSLPPGSLSDGAPTPCPWSSMREWLCGAAPFGA